MAAKRQSFLDKLERELPEPAQAETERPSRRKEAPAATQPHAGKDIVRTSVYIPAHVHQRLREIAFAERIKVHDLIMEGLDRVLAERGHAERTR